MKKILLLGAVLLSLGVQAWAKNVTTENRAVGAAFDKIAVEGRFDLLLTQGNTNAVSVEVEEEWQKDIKAEVKSGTLTLSSSKAFGRNKKRVRSTVHVTFQSLSALQVGGVGDVEAKTAIVSDSLEVRTRGVGDVKLQLKVKQVSVTSSGVGDVKLEGEAQELMLKSSGVGDVDAQQLIAEKVTVNTSSVGDVKVHASKELSLNNSGMGSFSYSGNAVITSLNDNAKIGEPITIAGRKLYEKDETLIIIAAIFGVFVAPIAALVLILFFVFRARHNKKKLQAEVYLKAREQGKELPANLFEQPAKSSLLNKGIMWAAVGVGVGVFFTFSSDVDKGITFGAIPLCVGAGYLLIHFIGKKQDGSGQR